MKASAPICSNQSQARTRGGKLAKQKRHASTPTLQVHMVDIMLGCRARVAYIVCMLSLSSLASAQASLELVEQWTQHVDFPAAVGVDADGNLYFNNSYCDPARGGNPDICDDHDTCASSIKKLSPAGQLLDTFTEGCIAESGGMTVDTSGYVYVCASQSLDRAVLKLAPSGSIVTTFQQPVANDWDWQPWSLALDEPLNRVYVTNYLGDEVLVYNMDGVLLNQWPMSNISPWTPSYVGGIAVAEDHNLIVGGGGIYKATPNGMLIEEIMAPDVSDSPQALDIWGNTLFVPNWAYGKLQIVDLCTKAIIVEYPLPSRWAFAYGIAYDQARHRLYVSVPDSHAGDSIYVFLYTPPSPPSDCASGGSASLEVPYIGKFRRVDLHGIPFTEQSPTAEAEDDRNPSSIYVDMFGLEPQLSTSDVRLPVEGGDLDLEFRRTASVSSYRTTNIIGNQLITYPSDRILGPGWHSNLASRVTIAEEPSLQVRIATVVDEVGTSYRYVDTGVTGEATPLPADTYYSINNQAERAVLFRADANTLVLKKPFGARLTYKRLGTFFAPSGGNEEEYFRLVQVEDRNQNRVVRQYLSDDPLTRESFHVASMHEQGHPERQISFMYSLGTGGNGTDWGDRLTSVTDALGHVTSYEYGPSSGVDGQFLVAVVREPVLDAEAGSSVSPRTAFSYHTADLAIEETIDPASPPASDPLTKNRFVGLDSVTDPRGHVTSFSYQNGYFPSSIVQGLSPNKYALRIRLTGLSTNDGPVSFERITTTHESVITRVTDTRANQTTYQFSGTVGAAANQIGKALYITQLARTSPIGTVRYTWSNDVFSNLLAVEDLNGHTISYEYANSVSKTSNQPTREVVSDGITPIATSYDYGVFSRLQGITDGEGKSATHNLDARGNRRSIEEELGKTTRYEYAADGFVAAMVDGDGRRTTYSRLFGPLGNYCIVKETVRGYGGELSLVTARTYDVMGNLVKMVDPNGNKYEYHYDALYRLVERIEPISGSATTTYTLNGDPVEQRDFLGNVITRSYDSMNRVTEERRPEDIVTSFTYGPAGEQLTRTDPEGRVFEYEYDQALRLIQTDFDAGGLNYHELREYGPNSGSGAFSYTSGFEPTRVADRRGNHTDTEYDGFYRPVLVIKRFSAATGYGAPPQLSDLATECVFNKVDNEIKRTTLGEADAGGNRVTYTVYDELHRKVGTAVDLDGDAGPYGGSSGIVGSDFAGDSDDQVTVFHLDLKGNQVGLVDPEGHLTETIFDGANRPVLVRQPGVEAGIPESTTAYDDNGNAVLTVDPNGNQTAVAYDARNRETQRILDLDGDGTFDPAFSGTDIVTVQGYDFMDNVTARTNSRGFTYNFEYDAAYREVVRQGPAVPNPENGGTLTRPEWSTGYDHNSNRIRETDPRGVVKLMEYDALNRIKTETAAYGTPDAVTTSHAYDENDNRVSETLDNGVYGLQTTTFGFDPFGRQESETRPGGAQVVQGYYRNGLLKSRTDPKGQVREYRYDTAGREADIRFLGAGGLEEQRLFSYDRANNVLSVRDRYGSSLRGYDALYRVTSERRDYSDPSSGTNYSYTVLHTYDRNGNETSTAYPATASVVQHVFDAGDRLSVVTDDGKPQTTLDNLETRYGYDAAGNIITVVAPNGVRTTKVYDALDRGTSLAATTPTSTVYSATYSFDLAGNRRAIDEKVAGQPGRVVTYGYDAQYRITSESAAAGATTYTYDLAGNRLSKQVGADVTVYSYNERNELLGAIATSGSTTYTYDLNGNLSERSSGSTVQLYTWDTNDRLVAASENASPVFEAQYDYRSRRLLKVEGGERTFFVHTEGLALEEVDLSNRSVQVEYVHGDDMGGGVGAILYGVRPGATAGGGKTRQLAKYEFFCSNHVGHTVALTNLQGRATRTELFDAFGVSMSTTGSSENTRRAYTKERDASLGFDNHGFRYYDSATGRYISRDPAGYVDGLNTYLHTANNPVNRFDPKGLLWEELKGAISSLMGRNEGSTVSRPTIMERIATSDAAGQALQIGERVAGFGLGVANALSCGTAKWGAEMAGGTAYDLGGWFRAGEWAANGALIGDSALRLASGLVRGGTEMAIGGGLNRAQLGALARGGEVLGADAVRFSQSSANGTRAARGILGHLPESSGIDNIANSMKAGGYSGSPVEIVQMPDGLLTAIDNSRVLAARLAGQELRATVNAFGDAVPPFMQMRLGGAKTFGEAVMGRIGRQSAEWRQASDEFGAWFTPKWKH